MSLPQHFYQGHIDGQPADIRLLLSPERIAAMQTAAERVGRISVQDLGPSEDKTVLDHYVDIRIGDTAALGEFLLRTNQVEAGDNSR